MPRSLHDWFLSEPGEADLSGEPHGGTRETTANSSYPSGCPGKLKAFLEHLVAAGAQARDLWPHADEMELALAVLSGDTHQQLMGGERRLHREEPPIIQAACSLLFSIEANAEVQTVNTRELSPKQQSIVTISAFTANGDLQKLKTSLNEGLDAGLTVNEIKEVLVQLYAYAGFPRSLNAINIFMTVMDERQKKGLKDKIGKEASPLPADMNKDEYGAKVRAKLGGSDVIPPPSGFQLFAPVIDTFPKEHLFADIIARDNLDFQSRELATISALASMTGTAGQLRFHLGAAMNVGLSDAQMKGFISVLEARVGKKEAEGANQVLTAVLQSRK